MNRAYLPFIFNPAAVVVQALGPDAERVALLAVRAVLRHARALEVAHEQVTWRGQAFAFSSRISAAGELVIELDVGDPRLAHHIVLEDELRAVTRKVRGIAHEQRRR